LVSCRACLPRSWCPGNEKSQTREGLARTSFMVESGPSVTFRSESHEREPGFDPEKCDSADERRALPTRLNRRVNRVSERPNQIGLAFAFSEDEFKPSQAVEPSLRSRV